MTSWYPSPNIQRIVGIEVRFLCVLKLNGPEGRYSTACLLIAAVVMLSCQTTRLPRH